jgi:hypothetical protein
MASLNVALVIQSATSDYLPASKAKEQAMITRYATIKGKQIRFVGRMIGTGCEDASLTAYDAEGVELCRFNIAFYGDEKGAGAGICSPLIVPDRNPSLINGISPGEMYVAALAAAFSVSDEELAGEVNSYETSVTP